MWGRFIVCAIIFLSWASSGSMCAASAADVMCLQDIPLASTGTDGLIVFVDDDEGDCPNDDVPSDPALTIYDL